MDWFFADFLLPSDTFKCHPEIHFYVLFTFHFYPHLPMLPVTDDTSNSGAMCLKHVCIIPNHHI